MKTITLAAALATATVLALPALAAGDATKTGADASATTTGTQATASMETGGQAAGMSGDSLSEDEVRLVQQALSDAGQDIEVDGQWGDNTAQALRRYQEEKGMEGSGELDPETIAALGIEMEGMDDPQQARTPDASDGSDMTDTEGGSGESNRAPAAGASGGAGSSGTTDGSAQ